ncbi:MAG: NAD(P)H-binding protein, partial [Candidatus Nanopelagicales bacterium]
MSGVFVTGATGTVGSAVVSHLLDRGQPVIAGVRSPADSVRLPAGAEGRLFDFGAPARDLEKALAGADRLFLMRPPAIADVRTFLYPVVDAARRVGVRQVVF